MNYTILEQQMTLLADHSTMLSRDFHFCLKIWNFKTFINEKISTFKKQCLLVRVQLHFCYQWLKKRLKTDDKTKLCNHRRRFRVTIIDSALIFHKVAALQCTAFDWQFNELEYKKLEKCIINAIAVLNKTTVQELKGYFFVRTQNDARLLLACGIRARVNVLLWSGRINVGRWNERSALHLMCDAE